jgi:hypothetical protein
VYTININHRGDDKPTTYTVYRQEEADDRGISYRYWKEAGEHEYGLSDDGYVAMVISKREYASNHNIPNVYLRFPWGYTFYNPKYPSKKLKAAGRKSNVTFTGKSYIEVQSGQSKMKNLAMMFALKPDYDLAIEWAMGAVTDQERRKWKRTMKSETFKNMVRDELQALLQDHGLTEKYTLDLLEESIRMCKDKKDITNLMRAVENLQDMHGMKDKHLVKTTDKLEAHSATTLIDELVTEEKSITATRTMLEEKDESHESPKKKEGGCETYEEVEESRETS